VTVAEENARPGSPDWGLRATAVAGGRSRAVEGYAVPTSVAAGDTLEVRVSADPAGAVSAAVFRLGWYGGAGARAVAVVPAFPVGAQPVPPPGPAGERECAWPVAFRLAVGEDWPSGVYLARLSRADGTAESYVPFVVRPSGRTPAVIVQTSDFTWQAYNRWPDDRSSLYDTAWWAAKLWPLLETADRTRRVSFERPYGIRKWDAAPDQLAAVIGSGEYLQWEYPLAFWLEREGVDVGYVANADTARDGVPAGAKAWISAGHDEYWTASMYAHVAAARDRGTALLFLSGNTAFTEIEMSSSSVTRAPYRVFRRKAMFTGREADLMGVASGFAVVGDDAWRCAAPDHWLFAGTGMRAGDGIPDLVGWETHTRRARTIPNLVTVAGGTIPLAIRGVPLGRHRWHATVYEAPSGAAVFAASTIYWPLGLARPPVPFAAHPFIGRVAPDERVAIMTRNLLRRAGA